MRIVELRLHPGGSGIRLHPRVTILRGLDPVARVGIVGMVHDLALGEVPDLDAIIEIDGIEYAAADAVELAGVTADSGLILPAENLPATQAEPAELDVLERALRDAERRVAELTDVMNGLAEELGSGETIRAEMKASLTSAMARIDESAAWILDQADAALVRVARAGERPDPWTGMDDVDQRTDHLRRLLTRLDEQEAALPSGDRAALAAALATARATRATDEVTAPEAAALAEVWSVLHGRLARYESRLEADDQSPDAAATRLEQARAAARAAEAGTVPRDITAEESQQLEELHEAMLEAEAKASKGIRKGAARAGYDAAAAALQDALEPLGFPTWAAFRMGNGKVSVSQEAIDAFEQAREELAAAEQEWARVAARLEGDSELQEVLEEIDGALARVTDLIGSDPRERGTDTRAVEERLHAVTIEPGEVGVAEAEAIERLRNVLTDAGAPGHEEVRSEPGLIVLGTSWLEALATADTARLRIERDRERARAELSALETVGGGSGVDRLDEERAAVRRAEETVAATRNALCDVVRSRVQLHVLAATELTLAQQHDDTVTELEAAEVLLENARRRHDTASGSEALAELSDRIPRGAGGAVPVVIVRGEAPVACLDVATRLAEDVQILVIGEGSDIDEWVEAVGPDVAVAPEASTAV